MRHAKSSWKSAAPTDHQRPLNKRGRRAAPLVARRLAELDWLPQLVLSSDATRTRQTYARMCEAAGFEARDVEVRLTRDLYLADVGALAELLAAVPTPATVLALGHNPGWQEALDWLAGDAAEEHVMKTGCAALLRARARSFAEAVRGPGGFELVDFIRPRELE